MVWNTGSTLSFIRVEVWNYWPASLVINWQQMAGSCMFFHEHRFRLISSLDREFPDGVFGLNRKAGQAGRH
jgi:hypothetical protein